MGKKQFQGRYLKKDPKIRKDKLRDKITHKPILARALSKT